MNKEELYSPDDIKKYIDGTMSREEMHRLEKDALDDAFLQDAIDGYMEAYASGEAGKIAAITAGLENTLPKPGATKYRNIVIPVWQIRIIKYAVAAMFIGGSGWYFFQGQNAVNEVASANTKPSYKVVADSTTSVATLRKAETQPAEQQIAPAATTPKKDVAATGDTKQVKLPPVTSQASSPASKNSENEADISTTAPITANATAPRPAAIISGKVTNRENDPLDNISLTVKGAKMATVTDDKGRFNLGIPDSNAVIVASAPGYITKERKASWFRNNALQLETASARLDEVVVSGYRARKKKEVPDDDIQIDTSEAVPAGGWKNFIDYLDKNNKLKQKGKKGPLVILTFEAGKTGIPEEFDIIQSEGDLMDDEAIRLIKEGPLWINKTRNPSPVVKLTIVF